LFQEFTYCEPGQLELPESNLIRLLIDCYEGETPDISFLYSSDDDGATWLTRQLPVSRSEGWPYQLRFFDASQGLLLGQTIYRTADGGRTWQRVRVLAWDRGHFSFVDPLHGWAIPVVGEATGLVATSDGGSFWTEIEPVAGELLSLNEIHDEIQMVSPEVGWAQHASGDPVLRTADGGRTWRDVTPQLEGYTIRNLAALDANTAWLTMESEDHLTFSVARTTDGGATWTDLGGGLPYPGYTIWFENRMDGWIANEGVAAGSRYIAFIETHDGGATWTSPPFVPNPPFMQDPIGVTYGYQDHRIVLAVGNMTGDQFYMDHARIVILAGPYTDYMDGGSVHLRITTNLGRTWQHLAIPYPPGVPAEARAGSRISFFGGTGFLPVDLWLEDSPESGQLAIYITRDGGSTWQLRPNVFPGALVDFFSARDGFLASQGVLYATHDSAATWQVVNPSFGSLFPGEELWQLDFVSNTTGWALSAIPNVSHRYQSVLTWWRTVDGGVTWTRLSPILVP
jgi:photosystem II stability/assembly factor-like uncharacterized protein